MNMPMHIHYKALHNLQNQQKNKSKLQETKHNYKKRKKYKKNKLP